MAPSMSRRRQDEPAESEADAGARATSLAAARRAELGDFDRLYREHFDALWRTARALGVPERHLEDVVQEVFIVAMRRADSYQGTASVRRWMVGILIKVAAGTRRKAKRDAAPLPEVLVDDDPRMDPGQRAMASQARDLLLEILDAMEEPQRTVWVLTESEKLSAREIADVLHVSPNTVSSRLRLARQHFDRHLNRLRAQSRWRRS